MGDVVLGSVIEERYLAEGRVLAESARAHHSGIHIAILVVGALGDGGADEPFEVLTARDVGIDDRELARRAAMYAPQELVSSCKPALLAHLLARHGPPVILLDADMLVLGDLRPLASLAREHAVVLSPHDPSPSRHVPGAVGFEQEMLRAGVFNGGVVSCGPGAERFLAWWGARTARDCVVDLDAALVMSQTWLTLVPALFDHAVLRDPGINVMGHNLGGRDIDWSDPERPAVGGAPLRAFHFSGKFDPHRPLAGFSGAERWGWWPDARDRPGLARLCHRYAELLLAAGHDRQRALPARFGVVGNLPLDLPMRRAHRAALIAAEAEGGPEPPTPLGDGPDAFLAWLAEPAAPGSPVSRWLLALHGLRADLRAAFPAVPGADDARLDAWARALGAPGPHGLPLAAAGP
jgi:hypothetical protein